MWRAGTAVDHAGRVAGIELVVTDLDGTLWRHDGDLPPGVGRAWRTIEERAIPIVVATGRRATSARVPLERFGLAPDAVVLDGALGLSLATGVRFHERAFAPTVAMRIVGLFSSLGLSPVAYVDDPLFDAFADPGCTTHPGHLALFGASLGTADLERTVAARSVLAFGLVGVDCDAAHALAALVAADGSGEARVNPSYDFAGCALTVVAAGISKWDGVVAYCAARGIDSDRVLAIGDGTNDVELLEHAAVGVTLDGASAAARAVADVVVAPVEEGGWAEIVDLL